MYTMSLLAESSSFGFNKYSISARESGKKALLKPETGKERETKYPARIVDIGTTSLKILNPMGNRSDSSGWLDYKREKIEANTDTVVSIIDSTWFEDQLLGTDRIAKPTGTNQEAIVVTGRSSNLVVRHPNGKALIIDSVTAQISNEQKAIIQKYLGMLDIRESSALAMLLALKNNPEIITQYFGAYIPFESLHITTMLGLVAELTTHKELPIPPDEKKSFYGGVIPKNDNNLDRLYACYNALFYNGQLQSQNKLKFMENRNTENIYVINDTPAEVGFLTQLRDIGVFPTDAMGFATDSWLKVGLFVPDESYQYRSMPIFASMNHHWVRPLFGLLSEEEKNAVHTQSDSSRAHNHYRLAERASIRGLFDMGKNPYMFMPVGETGRLFKKNSNGLVEISLRSLNDLRGTLPDVLDAVVAIEQGIIYGGRYLAERFAKEYGKTVHDVVLYGALANIDPNFAELCATCWPGVSFSVLELSNGGEAAASMWRAQQAKAEGIEKDFKKHLFAEWKDKIQPGIYSIEHPHICWEGEKCPDDIAYEQWRNIYTQTQNTTSC